MYWVVILFLANSAWQIAVCFPILLRLTCEDGLVYVVDGSICSASLVHWNYHYGGIPLRDWRRRD